MSSITNYTSGNPSKSVVPVSEISSQGNATQRLVLKICTILFKYLLSPINLVKWAFYQEKKIEGLLLQIGAPAHFEKIQTSLSSISQAAMKHPQPAVVATITSILGVYAYNLGAFFQAPLTSQTDLGLTFPVSIAIFMASVGGLLFYHQKQLKNQSVDLPCNSWNTTDILPLLENHKIENKVAVLEFIENKVPDLHRLIFDMDNQDVQSTETIKFQDATQKTMKSFLSLIETKRSGEPLLPLLYDAMQQHVLSPTIMEHFYPVLYIECFSKPFLEKEIVALIRKESSSEWKNNTRFINYVKAQLPMMGDIFYQLVDVKPDLSDPAEVNRFKQIFVEKTDDEQREDIKKVLPLALARYKIGYKNRK